MVWRMGDMASELGLVHELMLLLIHAPLQDEGEEYLEYSRSPDATVPGFTPEAAMCISPGFAGSSPARQSHAAQGHDVHRARR